MTTHAGRWSHKLDVLFCNSGDQIQQFGGAQWEFLDSETLKLVCYMYVHVVVVVTVTESTVHT